MLNPRLVSPLPWQQCQNLWIWKKKLITTNKPCSWDHSKKLFKRQNVKMPQQFEMVSVCLTNLRPRYLLDAWLKFPFPNYWLLGNTSWFLTANSSHGILEWGQRRVDITLLRVLFELSVGHWWMGSDWRRRAGGCRLQIVHDDSNYYKCKWSKIQRWELVMEQ